MNRTWNNRAWFMVLPVLVLVAFSAVIPLMTVVNYSVQDTFGGNQFFWAGTEWFQEMLTSDRFWAAMGRNLIFSGIILAIEIPLGIFIALKHAAIRLGRPGLPRPDGASASGAVERRRHHLAGLRPRRYRPARLCHEPARIDYKLRQRPVRRLVTVIVMDVWHWTSLVVLLCYAGLVSFPMPTYQAARSTARRAGRSSATSSCRR